MWITLATGSCRKGDAKTRKGDLDWLQGADAVGTMKWQNSQPGQKGDLSRSYLVRFQYIYICKISVSIYIYISIVYIYIYIRIHRFWCSPIFGRMIPNDPSVSDGLLHRCHRWPSRRGMWKLVSCRPVRRERGGKVLLDLHSSILDWMSHDESLCYWLKQLAFHCETIGGLNI